MIPIEHAWNCSGTYEYFFPGMLHMDPFYTDYKKYSLVIYVLKQMVLKFAG